jgi:hypothetical protein
VIEAIPHFSRQHPIDMREIDDHAGRLVELTPHRHVADVGMTVVVGAGAEAEDLRVTLVGPLRDAIAVRGGERDAASEVECHGRVRC